MEKVAEKQAVIWSIFISLATRLVPLSPHSFSLSTSLVSYLIISVLSAVGGPEGHGTDDETRDGDRKGKGTRNGNGTETKVAT